MEEKEQTQQNSEKGVKSDGQEKRWEEAQKQDISEILAQELDKRARDLGYRDWEDMQAKLLEEQGRFYELLEKTKKEAEEKIKKLLEELERERKEKLELFTSLEIKKLLSQREVVDVEKAFKLLRAEGQMEVKDGKVFINGEPAEKFLEKFLQENTFLLKVKGQGSGAGHNTASEKVLTPEERIRQGIEKMLGGKR
jgi:hypothetical protein